MQAPADHPVPSPAHTRPDPHTHRRPPLILPLGSPPLQIPGTTEANFHLRVGAQPQQVALIELIAAAPTHRHRRLRRLLRNSHTAIICPTRPRGHQLTAHTSVNVD
jgi:hypothetical protein